MSGPSAQSAERGAENAKVVSGPAGKHYLKIDN